MSAQLLRQEKAGVKACRMVGEIEGGIQHGAFVIELLEAETGHVAEVSELIVNAGIGGVGIIGVFVIIGNDAVFDILFRGVVVIAEQIETMVPVEGSLEPGFQPPMS